MLVNDICTSYGVVCAWNTSTMTFWPHFFCKWVHNWGCHHLLWTLTTKLVFFQCLSTNHAMLVLFTFFFLVYRNPGWLQIWGHQGPFHTVEVKSLIKSHSSWQWDPLSHFCKLPSPDSTHVLENYIKWTKWVWQLKRYFKTNPTFLSMRYSNSGSNEGIHEICIDDVCFHLPLVASVHANVV